MHKENSMRLGNSLQDKRVVVLGGSSGIGLEVAKQAASQGASVIIASSSAERVQKAVESVGGEAQGQAVDVSDERAVATFFLSAVGVTNTGGSQISGSGAEGRQNSSAKAP
jgi:NAD(P)-dependent dehydrogenase (short-subunit alcohol dehydrogenase family)